MHIPGRAAESFIASVDRTVIEWDVPTIDRFNSHGLMS